MDLDLINKLKNSGLQSATDFINLYALNEDTIVRDMVNFSGIKSELYCRDFYQNIDTLKFLSLYSDFTSVFMMPGETQEHLIHYYDPEDPLWVDRQVIFPVEVLDGRKPEPYELLPGYTTQIDSKVREVSQKLAPLFERGKCMMRPIRTVMFTHDKNAIGRRPNGTIYYANSDTPNNHWEIKSLNEKNSYVIDNGLKSYQSKVLFEITLPYLNNITIDNLTKITDEESDLLGGFRSALKQLMIACVGETEILVNEIRNDKIRPQIEEINRKFTTVSNMHKLSVGATVAAFSIALVAVTVTAATNFQTLFNSLIGGSSTIGFLTVENKYQTDIDKLKDNPYFLLWKVSRVKTSRIKTQF